jgi:hypothetical protein
MDPNRTVMRFNPIQILSANPGWMAIYSHISGCEHVDPDQVASEEPVVMWALCHVRSHHYKNNVMVEIEEEENMVVPMVVGPLGLEIPNVISNYMGVRPPEMPLVEWLEEWGPGPTKPKLEVVK